MPVPSLPLRSKVNRWLRSVSLAGAISLAGVLVAGTATVVLYLTGYPWLHNWGWSAAEMSWQTRLTYAAAVVTVGGALIALVVSYRKQRDAEAGRFTADFAQAASQLGGESAAVRLAGAYAMAAIADRDVLRRQQCIDVLCGYLRLPYSRGRGRQVKMVTQTTPASDAARPTVVTTVEETHLAGEDEVRATIIRLIRYHLNRTSGRPNWHGCSFDLTGAPIDKFSLAGCTLIGNEVIFGDSDLTGSRIDLSRVVLIDSRVELAHCTMIDTTVTFSASHILTNSSIFIFQANLVRSGLKLGCTVAPGGLLSLQELQLTESDVSMTHATMDGEADFFVGSADRSTVSFNYARIGRPFTLTFRDIADSRVMFAGAHINAKVDLRSRDWTDTRFVFASIALDSDGRVRIDGVCSPETIELGGARFEGGAPAVLSSSQRGSGKMLTEVVPG